MSCNTNPLPAVTHLSHKPSSVCFVDSCLCPIFPRGQELFQAVGHDSNVLTLIKCGILRVHVCRHLLSRYGPEAVQPAHGPGDTTSPVQQHEHFKVENKGAMGTVITGTSQSSSKATEKNDLPTVSSTWIISTEHQRVFQLLDTCFWCGTRFSPHEGYLHKHILPVRKWIGCLLSTLQHPVTRQLK